MDGLEGYLCLGNNILAMIYNVDTAFGTLHQALLTFLNSKMNSCEFLNYCMHASDTVSSDCKMMSMSLNRMMSLLLIVTANCLPPRLRSYLMYGPLMDFDVAHILI